MLTSVSVANNEPQILINPFWYFSVVKMGAGHPNLFIPVISVDRGGDLGFASGA